MAVSDAVGKVLGCENDDLVGLTWASGMNEIAASNILGLGAQSEMEIEWKGLKFMVKRDVEQPMMWWSLL